MTKQIHKYVRECEQWRKYFAKRVRYSAYKQRTRNWWKAWRRRYKKEENKCIA